MSTTRSSALLPSTWFLHSAFNSFVLQVGEDYDKLETVMLNKKRAQETRKQDSKMR